MTRIGTRLALALLVMLLGSGAVRAARRPVRSPVRSPARDGRLVELDRIRSRVRVPSLGALADAGGAGGLGGLGEEAWQRRYRSGEAAARREALAVARRAFAAGKQAALARAEVLARKNASARSGWAPGKRRGRFKAGRRAAVKAQQTRLWRRAMRAAFARYQALEERAYAEAQAIAAHEVVLEEEAPGVAGVEDGVPELVVGEEGARGAPTEDELSLPAQGFEGEGYQTLRPRFAPERLDGGGALFGLGGE